jgi:hypothetical protein
MVSRRSFDSTSAIGSTPSLLLLAVLRDNLRAWSMPAPATAAA